MGVNVELMWSKIYDTVLKSFISVEKYLFDSTKEVQTNPNSTKSNFFELFGYDILLDNDLNPWILEVNRGPSLKAESPIDFHVKSNLLIDMFNLVGIRRLPAKRTA
jgi:tubulin polyglutamylase TTLL4